MIHLFPPGMHTPGKDVWNQTNPLTLVIPRPLKLSSPKNFSRPNKQLSLHGNTFPTACSAWLKLKRMKTTPLANSIFDVQDDEHQTSDDEQTKNDLDIDEKAWGLHEADLLVFCFLTLH
ncbi:hypothetical protein BGX38DRAFT_1141582 [Terfezia claveryi]|nr:hypothetical protein BGX38DRAFT_1141582 [Terfezia claveryi]